MKKLVIYGAYDRYNYGDNLMPILFELFLAKYYPKVLLTHELIFSSISESDLSRFEVKKTQPINECVKQKDISAVIVIGGEVLCARSSVLFTHMSHFMGVNFLMAKCIRVMPRLADKVARLFYPMPWDFPYVPDIKNISGDIKVAYNTVGGDLGGLSSREKKQVLGQLNNADYVSFRDSRTVSNIGMDGDFKLYPDSVCVVSDLVDEKFLIEHSSLNLDQEYVCFQAAPNKIGYSARVVSEVLKEIALKLNVRVVLLPIGYAAGHDDFEFLEEVHAYIPDLSTLLYDLNVWEIMLAIKKSKLFLGTSLHGCVTALSFGVCCVGVNPRIKKVDDFLKCWSVAPVNKSFDLLSLAENIEDIVGADQNELSENAIKLRDLAAENYRDMINGLGIDSL